MSSGDARARPARLALLAGLAPALVLIVLAWPALDESSAIYDETEHVPAGYTYVTRGDYRLGPEHPPLVKTLAALALLGQSPTISPAAERAFAAARHDIDAHWVFGRHFLFTDNLPGPLLWRPRAVVLALAAVLVLVVFAWGREVFGVAGGMLAATAAALDPNLLAHGTLVTTDLGFTVFFVLALYGARRAFRRLTLSAALGTGAAIAAAFASKHSALLLVPCLTLLAGARLVSRTAWPGLTQQSAETPGAGARALRVVALLVLWGAIAWGGLWATYGLRWAAAADGVGNLPIATWTTRIREIAIAREHFVAGTPVPPPATISREAAARPPGVAERTILLLHEYRLVPEGYSFGLAFATAMAQVRRAFLLGDVSLTGWTSYFPLAFVMKTPLTTLVLLALALALLALARARPPGAHLGGLECVALLTPPLIVMGAAMVSHLNIGYRHILPALPFVHLLVGAVPLFLERLVGRRPAAVACGAAALLLCVETVSARPYFLSFFNAAAGGARGGLGLLSDSNLDWGQGLPALKRWMRAEGVPQVNLAYFGTADPAAYGIDFVPLAGTFRLAVPGAGGIGYSPRPPELPGWVAVSATHLQGTYLLPVEQRLYAPLRARAPDAVVADSIYLYRLTAWPPG